MSSEELKLAIRNLFRANRGASSAQRRSIDMAPGCAFGAVVDQRLKDIDASLGELRSRVNGLIFLVVGAVLVQVVMQLIR